MSIIPIFALIFTGIGGKRLTKYVKKVYNIIINSKKEQGRHN